MGGRNMEIFAVANSKGGCGKTTTSIHIADLIAQKKFSVLLVDFDPQGHSTMTFVKEPQAIKHNIGDALLDEKPTSLRQACIKINDYLTLLPSGISLASLEQSLHGKKNREFYLREKLRELAGNFDFVIIDCPPQLGLLTINAFLAAEKVIIPLDTSVFAMRGVEQTLDIFNLLSNKLKHKIEYKILLTNFISQTKYSQEIFGDIKKKYPHHLFETKIGYSMVFKQAIEERKLVWELAPRSQAAMQYKKLMEEFLMWSDHDTTANTASEESGSNPYGRGVKISRNKVEFVYFGLKSTEVQLIGDFNNWLPDQHSLKFDPAKKVWRTQIKLDAGSYQYQYVVDGKITPDPENPTRAVAVSGKPSSVVEVY